MTEIPGADVATGVASLHKDDAAGEGPPFRRVLIANRGEIALRIIRACRESGIETVAVHSDADVDAAHVRAADVAVRLGPAPAAESYLRADAIIDAALATGAEAIHPGYGFLAERASFAAAVEAAGLAFVGPPSGAIASLGDKLAARRLAREAGVPVVPGTLEPAAVDRPDGVGAILAEAARVGFPLLVKAAAGGGGRGMRRVERAADLPAALAAGAAESAAAFGDGSVYLEREVRPARHIEVQLIADAHGGVVALGERDCSVQRRHQKLVEEAPAPGLTDEERRLVHGHAVRLARAAGLVNAATAEFLFDTDRRFWFLEVNTRLQVEHGVTELAADVDIVREQLRIAAGRRLSERILAAGAAAVRPTRHAIEVRLSAEDPAAGFAPAPGRLGRWVEPAGPGVRMDGGVRPGDPIPAEYDPLVAKLLVVDEDRPHAIARLSRALDELVVTGISTTLPFHRWLVRDAAFRAAELSTDLVPARWEPVAVANRSAALARAVRVAAAHVVRTAESPGGARGRPTAGPGGGWRAEARSNGVERWPR